MFDLHASVNEALAKLVADDAIRPVIEKQVRETVGEIVTDALGRYSEFSKQVEAQVKAAIHVGELGLGGYNEMVSKIVREQLNQVIEENGRKMLQANMEELLAGATRRQVKVSELVKEFAEEVRERRGAADRFTVILESSSYGSRYLFLDREPNKEKYRCEYMIWFSDDRKEKDPGRVLGITHEGRDHAKTIFVGPFLYGFEKTLFHLYATGSTIVVDTEDLSGEIPDED